MLWSFNICTYKNKTTNRHPLLDFVNCNIVLLLFSNSYRCVVLTVTPSFESGNLVFYIIRSLILFEKTLMWFIWLIGPLHLYKYIHPMK